MRKALVMVAALAVLVTLTFAVKADDAKKEVTLKGKMVCGKCTLKVCDACTNVLQVKEKDKTVDYFIKDKGNKETYHKGCCKPDSSQDVEVTGTVAEKDGKKWLTASKVDVKK
jgi:hypothetical protein